jgi:hypothetical protein
VVWKRRRRNSWPAARAKPSLEELAGGALSEEGNKLRTVMMRRRKDAYLRQDERRAPARTAVPRRALGALDLLSGRAPSAPTLGRGGHGGGGELSWRIRHSRPWVQSESH